MSGGGTQPAGAIRHKLKQAAYRHLKRHLEKALRETPENCMFNGIVDIPGLGSEVGVCIHNDKEGERLCDARFNPELATECGLFVHCKAKDEVKSEFHEFLASASLAEVAARYPDVAALLWVLQEEAPGRDVDEGGEDEWEPGGDVEVYLNHLRLLAPDDTTATEAQQLINDLMGSLKHTREQLESTRAQLHEAENVRDFFRRERDAARSQVDEMREGTALPAVRKRPWWKFWGMV